MSAIPTIRIQDPDVPTGILINVADFDPSRHRRFEEAAHGADHRAERAKELAKLSAEDVRALAEAASVEYTTKPATIEALLAVEFPAE